MKFNLRNDVVKELALKEPTTYSFIERGDDGEGWSVVPYLRKKLNFGLLKSAGIFLVQTQLMIPIEKLLDF